MYKLLLIFSCMLSLISCHHNKKTNPNTAIAGPLVFCPYGMESTVIKKIDELVRNNLSDCYDHSLGYLSKNHLLSGKITWMKATQSDEAIEGFINNALIELGSMPLLHQELADIYIKQKKWNPALQELNLAKVKINNPKRFLVETHLGEYSYATDLDLLPYIYRNIPLKIANVKQNQSSDFELQKISDGNTAKINGEPSITSSPDGQNIWLLWTDSGQSTTVNGFDFNFWNMQSSQSIDGGDTWTPVTMNTLPEQIDRFHFDPMSIYDKFNNIIYAGGMVKGFGPDWGATKDDAMFFYRWELDNDANFGPFKTFIPQPDKGWMTTDVNGNITLAHHFGIDSSTDRAENFSTVASDFFTSAQPRILSNGCLFITDINRVITCENNIQVDIMHNFSSAYDAQDKIPGTFRVFNFAQNAIHPNGDIYVVYHEFKSINSSDVNIQMTKSNNNGLTWSDPWVISSNINRDQFDPWIEIDKYGGIHVIFFDSRNGLENDDSADATLDIYYQYSNDFGQTWTETRVTPTSFKLPELIWGDYFFSDYISLAVSDDSVYLAFPWSQQDNQMHMYFAKKPIHIIDLIFTNDFE